MKVLLDRWQFGVTITYYFLFVPLCSSRSPSAPR
jgi:cytochrome bd-type quinol oxidase subunit 1